MEIANYNPKFWDIQKQIYEDIPEFSEFEFLEINILNYESVFKYLNIELLFYNIKIHPVTIYHIFEISNQYFIILNKMDVAPSIDCYNIEGYYHNIINFLKHLKLILQL